MMSEGRKIRVMVAEDIPILREDFAEIIGAEPDMELLAAARSGSEICRLVEEAGELPDIILMDIEMETLTAGIDASETIHGRHPQIRIVFMTAHEADEMINSGMGTGAVDYVIKGCDDQVLLDHIRKAYRGVSVLDSRIQQSIMREYTRLRKSEHSLVFLLNNVTQLTPTEKEIVSLLLEDKKVREIAQLRNVELVTVKTQIKSLLNKFGCHRSREIVELIRQMNLESFFRR
ncbi:response regulator receiver domain protein [Shuttleworthella sp. MSX8B]|uniref:Stage 0 sporulation protein A homolog n=3 Tax=Shuttleworthella TaxID=177971 RepID=C4GA59_9FIRM|nr:response regulator receiver domain protein [Shuttleworthia satelles DSM 14600]EUB13502.1 response regulator receiver domain protein [Shuttleworthia sp. MSX8B]